MWGRLSENLQDVEEDMSDALISCNDEKQIDLQQCRLQDNFFIGSGDKENKWFSLQGASFYWVKATAYSYIRITANSNVATYIFIIANQTRPEDKVSPNFASGESSRRVIPVGTTATLALPTNCNYIAISGKYSESVDTTPVSVVLHNQERACALTNDDIEIGGQQPISSQLGKEFIAGTKKTYTANDVSWINGLGMNLRLFYPQSLSGHKYCTIPCCGADHVNITLLKYTAASAFGCAFFDENANPICGQGFVGNIEVDWGVYTLKVPSNASYLVTTWISSSHPIYGSWADLFRCEVVFDGINKNDNNDVLVGAVYFDGWSYTRGIPYNQISKLLVSDQYNHRQPLTGWIEERSVNAVGWLKSPYIELGNNSMLSFVTNCVFWQSAEQCMVYVRENEGMWHEIQIVLPSAVETDFSTIQADISSWDNKRIQLGFRIKTFNSYNSAIWQIKSLSISSDDSSIFQRDFTKAAQRDFDADGIYWEIGDYGYNGNTYNMGDTLAIDREIALAKSNGIDYFAFCWYPIFNGDNIDAKKEETLRYHRALKNYIRSCNKYDFKFCIYICNHGTNTPESYYISNQTQWNNCIQFLIDNYFCDQSYLKKNGKPLIFTFGGISDSYLNGVNNYLVANTEYTHGLYWGINKSNTWYNCFSDSHYVKQSGQAIERPMSDITDGVKANIKDVTNLIPTATVGWNSKPWILHHPEVVNQDYFSRNHTTDLQAWKEQLQFLFDYTNKLPYEFKTFIIYAWNELGEGGYLMPTKGDPQGLFLKAIKEVKDTL